MDQKGIRNKKGEKMPQQGYKTCIIGKTLLAIDCSKILVRNGFSIELVFTDDPAFHSWASSINIEIKSTKSFLTSDTDYRQFDYLFSIVNDIPVPSRILGDIGKLSINYHNGPLPKYAGANATNWALIKGEKKHGVTWHVMEETIDTGSILAMEDFIINESDNFLTVSWKCKDAAERTLNRLCLQLKVNSLCRQEKRLTYKAYQKPSPFCMLPLHLPASEVYNFFRGTFHLRNHPATANKLGLPKIVRPNGKLLIVAGIEIEDRPAIKRPGTVVSVMDNYVRIATDSNNILVKEFLELDGSSILKPFSRTLKGLKGVNLIIPETLNSNSCMSELSDLCGNDEKKWAKYLIHHEAQDVLSLVWPYYAYANATTETTTVTLTNKILVKCEGRILAHLEELCPKQVSRLHVLSAFVAFLLAMSPSFEGCFDVMCNNIPKEYTHFFLQCIPVSYVLKPEQSLQSTVLEIAKLLAEILQGKKSLVAADVYLRYPIEQPKCSIAVALPGDPKQIQPLPVHKIIIFSYVRAKTIEIAAVFGPNYFPRDSFKTVEDDFCAFLNSTHLTSDKSISSHRLCGQHTEDMLLNNPTLKGPNIDTIPVWLHERFVHSVELFPDVVAIVDEFGHYTYSELNKRAHEIGSTILKLADGVAIKTVVFLLKRTWECIASMLAVSMIGSCFVPIDIDSPMEHINFILEDSNADVVLVDEFSHCYGISGKQCLLISLDQVSSSNQLASVCFELPPSPENAAAIMYTSGTTGKPKGVITEHMGLCNILTSYILKIGFTQRTRAVNDLGSGEFQMLASSLSFDACFLDIFPGLWSGGTVLVLPANLLEKSRCYQFLRYITCLITQPVRLSSFDPEVFVSTPNVTFGGEASTKELIKPWKAPGRRLWNVYGPTETTIITTICNVQELIHLGQCTGNALLKILNPQKQLVPFGVAGELHVGGKGVGRYTNEQLTLKAFWKEECSGMRFYRTGDLVYLDEDYKLYFIGRIPKDKQLKIGGVRVELMGVQHIFRQLPDIKFAHVVEEKTTKYISRLVAYVSPDNLDPVEIKKQLCQKVPKAMIPSLIIPIPRDAISFTSSGKFCIDRSKLKNKICSPPNYVSPSSDIEKQIVSFYQKCLGIENDVQFGMNDKFTDFGGDSVAAVYLANEVRLQLSWNVQPSDIVQLTPSELFAKYSPLVKDAKYLTSMQKALMSMNRILLGSTYNIPITFQISGKTCGLHIVSALEKALPILRQAFWEDNTKTFSCTEHVSHVDLCSLPLEEGQKSALKMVQKDAVCAIDLNKSPFRCTLYYLSSDRWILSLVIHHLVFDYASWGCLQQLIEYAYCHKFSDFQAYWVPFNDFLECDQKEYGKNSSQIIDFWTNHLKPCQLFVDFPTTFPRPRCQCYRGRRTPFTFDLSTSTVLDFCKARKIDPLSFFLSTFAVLIYSISHKHSFGIGVTVSRRMTANMKRIVGLLVNTVLCCFPFDKLQDSFANLLQYVQTWHKEALRYSSVHFQDLVNLCIHNPPKGVHHTIPQFFLNYISKFQQPCFELGSDVDTDFLDIQTYTAKAELFLEVRFLGSSFQCTLEYSTALFSKRAMDNLISNYIQLIHHSLHNSYDTGFYQIFSTDMATRASPTIKCKESTTHTILPLSGYQLSVYKEFIEMPIHLTAKFHATFSLRVASNTDIKQVQVALHAVAKEYPYLKSSVFTDSSACACLKVQSAIMFQVYYETVLSEVEFEAVKLREQQWPFDIFTPPLFHCLLINCLYSNSTQLLLVVHQLLLNEVSIRLFARLLNASLTQKPFSIPDRPDCPSESALDSDSALQYWTKCLGNLEQPFSFGTSEISHNSSIQEDCNIPFQSEKELQVLCCAFTSLFTWELQKTPNLQFCLLYPTSNKLQASEYFVPISVKMNSTSLHALYNSLHAYISETSLHPLPSYWNLQEQLNPFTSMLHPYHDVVLQIFNLPHCSNELSHFFPRAFKVLLSFEPLEKKVTLTTYLNTQQTLLAHQCLKGLLSIFSTMLKAREVPISHWLPRINLPTSKCSGKIQDTEHSLKDMLQSVLSKFKYSIAYYDCIRAIEAKTPCCVTYAEAFQQCHQLVSHINSVFSEIQSCDFHQIAILTSGGFEQPLATLAAVLSGHVFLMIDPAEKVSLLIEKLTLASVSLLLYDFKCLSIAEKVVSQLPQITTRIVDLYYEQWEDEQALLPLADSNISYVDDENTMSKTMFIVFTSGTAGKPKAIPVPEISFCNFLLWFNSILHSDHLWWIQFMYPCIDVYVCEIFTQLLHGNCLVLINMENKLNFFYTFNIMRSYSIQGIFIIPTVLSLMLNKTYHKDGRKLCWNGECLRHLRQVFSIGEILPKHTCTTFFQRFQLWVLLHNFGGPAECGVAYAHCILNNQRCLEAIPMGHLVTNSEVCIINPHSLQPVPLGMLGEIVISGLPVFYGYIDGDTKSFFFDEVGKKWYHTGDIGYIDNLQQVVLLHRLDTQIKLHGQRISLSGIQEMIRQLNLPYLHDVIVDVIQKDDVLSLVCFPIISEDTTDSEKEIQESFIKLLPKKYVPLVIQCYNSSTTPRLLSGKIDLKTLRKVATTMKTPSHAVAVTESIPVLHDCLTRILPYTKHMESTNWLNMSLDSLGLSSVHKVQLHQMLLDMNYQVKMSSILISQNFRDLARKMTNEQKKGSNLRKDSLIRVSALPDERIAIIAMEVNVPGASTCEEFWGLISNGNESISHNLPCSTLLKSQYPNGHYVGSRGVIQNREMFDAQLFNVIDVDARFMDPQQRLLLHAVWTSLEKAGYDPTKFSENGKIGCFAGAQFPSYMLNCLKSNSVIQYTDQIVWGSLRDNVALRIGKCLNFRGPCITIANNCATFAVAMHLARCSLLRGECDLAVVAAASVSSEKTGYIAREGDIYSHDGHCCPFSKFASGTVMSDGIIVIVLRRLSNAEESGDKIACCIKISAIGSDGAEIKRKQYVPSVEGQADVLRIALHSIEPRTIGMVEAHGTGTRLGDEVELESLNSVFQELGSGDNDTCIIGSVKGNIGHLGIASAGAGIVKAALALKHAQLAPSINCDVPIPSMSKTPFVILPKPQLWQSSGPHPRRALVHSIGVMGTNSAIILEEYQPPTIPRPEQTTMSSKESLGYPVCISAKTPQSLFETCKTLAQYISQRAVSIMDVSYTLLVGRQSLPVRRAEVFYCLTNLSEWLTASCCTKSNDEVSVCIAFSGQGSLMERLLLSNFCQFFPSFKQTLQMYCDFLVQKYPSHDQVMEIKNFINSDINSGTILANMKPTFHHPLIVLSQLSLYRLLTDLGLIVDIVLGHSLGEYTAACIAGVFSPEEVLEIVYERALLIEKFVPKGKMISVQISAQELQAKYINFIPSLEIACYNSTTQSVISGSPHDIECLKSALDSDGINCKVLPVEHAYHHSNLRSIQSKLEEVLKAIPSKETTTTFITTLHDSCEVYHIGSILSPQYWIKQLDTPVDFIFALEQLCGYHSECHQPGPLQVIECGIEPMLNRFIVANQSASVKCTTFTLKPPHKRSAMSALAIMWENGVNIKLYKLPLFTGAQRLTLPTYVFDTQPYWIGPDGAFTSSVPEKIDGHDTPVVQGWDLNEVTVEKALALIKSFTGPGYDQQFPPDSMFQTFIREKILEMSHFKIDINYLLQQNAPPRKVAEYVVSQLEPHTSKSLSDSYQMVKCLSPGQKAMANTPIFIINAVAGQTYSFTPLALLLSEAYTVYGVYAPVTLMNSHSIEECASLFLCQMKKVQSVGPYIIGGYSFGAWVAQLITVMLENLGECVSLLFMIDPLHLENLRQSLDIAHLPKVFERTMLGEDYNLSQHPNESVVADYAQKLQIQLKLLVQYKDTIKRVTCPTRILLASERIMSLDESTLMKPQTWDLVCSVEVLKVHKIPGKHSTCIASINCPHIVANLEILPYSVNVHYPIPIGSVSELVGLWSLSESPWLDNSPVTTIKTSDCELLQQSRLLLNADGNYFCMIPKLVLDQALPKSDFELEKMESVVLNSSGIFSITSSEGGEVAFSVAISLAYPNMVKCDVPARAMAVNGLLRLCIGKLCLLWCKI